jgi:hypothetical protein
MTRPHPVVAVTCPDCEMTSHNPGDIDNLYCGRCHEFGRVRVIISNWEDPWDKPNPPERVQARLGCWQRSHERLGFCSSCPNIGAEAELMAWRYEAMNAMVPGYRGAVLFTAHLNDRG